LEFARWSRQKRDHAALVFEPQTGGSAARIIKDFRAFGNHRLAQVDGGHVALEAAEPRFDVAHYVVVAAKLAVEEIRDSFARKVVFRRAEAAAGDDDRNTVERVAKGFGEEFTIVPNNGFTKNLDAELVQLFGKEEGVRVDPIGGKQFGTNGNDFGFHGQIYCSSPANGVDLRGKVAELAQQGHAVNVPVESEESAVGGDDGAAAREESKADERGAVQHVLGAAIGGDAHDATASTERRGDI
jgi:hypothetical protein